MSDIKTKQADVLHYWFSELTPAQWFKQSDALDSHIKARFATTLDAAARGECWTWRETAAGRLAEIIVLDQFSRNIYRGSAHAFSQDSMALVLAQEGVRLAMDKELEATEKAFLYMPYMHSESRLIHKQAMVLFAQPGLEQNYDFEVKHKAIIDRFGRYPHRNELLGRASSADEIEFLQQPGSSF